VSGARAATVRHGACALLSVSLLAARVACAQDPPGPAALPPGEGRELVVRACGACHSLDAVTRAHLSARQWQARLDEMLARGAKLSDAEYDVVADYLTRNFGPPGGH
jgi:mono/diheme cytochrome c family protein